MTNAIEAIQAVGAPLTAAVAPPQPTEPAVVPAASFSDLIARGVDHVEQRVDAADDLVRRFALDGDAVPIHEVTIALERARLAVELMTQVRMRVVEAYREIMSMQL